MFKRSLVLVACLLITASCSTKSSGSSTYDVNVGTENELRAGTARVQELKEELVSRGLHIASTSSSDSSDEEMLKGELGSLKEVEVTLRVAKRLDVQQSHFRAIVEGRFPNAEARTEYQELGAHINSTIRGDK